MKKLASAKTAALFAIAALCFVFATGNAQLKGGHLLGDMGLKSGSQAPANTLSVFTPLYLYNAGSLRDDNGDEIAKPNINVFLAGAGVNWVSDLKILGATYGASALFCFMSNRLDGNAVQSSSDFAFSDTFIQPIQLGWNKKRADFFASYQLYIPTGKYEQGGSNNSGLGMWINEFSGGSTVYLTPDKKWHFAALLFYEMHSKKKDTDIKVGDILSAEGGLGKTFYVMNAEKTAPKSIINAGLIYYAQFKMTHDEIPVGPLVFNGEKDHIYALGAEGSFVHLSSQTSLSFRWLSELGAIDRFQGNTFFLNLAYIFSTKKE